MDFCLADVSEVTRLAQNLKQIGICLAALHHSGRQQRRAAPAQGESVNPHNLRWIVSGVPCDLKFALFRSPR